jgi:hypothetical protein
MQSERKAKMPLRKDWDDLNKNGNLGDFCFFDGSDGVTYIAFRYPHQDSKSYPPEYMETYRGEISHVPVTTGEKQEKYWLWDGNREAPTISPSINIVGQWHGFIRNGYLETV